MSELLKTVESFVDDFVPTESVNDDELMKYRDHGWVCELKNFNSIFEEMAKASNRLHQNGVDAIQTLEVRQLDLKILKNMFSLDSYYHIT